MDVCCFIYISRNMDDCCFIYIYLEIWTSAVLYIYISRNVKVCCSDITVKQRHIN